MFNWITLKSKLLQNWLEQQGTENPFGSIIILLVVEKPWR